MAGDLDKAAASRTRSSRRRAKRTDGRTLSLFLSTKNRDPDRALALAEAEKKVRGDLYTDDAYAWALHRKGRDADARVAIDRALSHGTKDALLFFHSGAIRMSSGDVAGGKKLVAQALALNPKFDMSGAEEAARLLGVGDAGAR